MRIILFHTCNPGNTITWSGTVSSLLPVALVPACCYSILLEISFTRMPAFIHQCYQLPTPVHKKKAGNDLIHIEISK